MSQRIILLCTGLVLLSTYGIAVDSGPRIGRESADGEIRRVVVIHIETTRRRALSLYGGIARTPKIDSVAAAGMVFTNAIVPVAKTGPSSASFLTGRHTWRNGVYTNGIVLSERLVTLPEILRDRGFLTAALIHNEVLLSLSNGKSPGFDQGFDIFRHGGEVEIEVPEDGHKNEAVRNDAEVLTRSLLDFIGEHEEDRLFLWTFYFDPHAPYSPPAPYDTMYRNHRDIVSKNVMIPEEILRRTFAYVPGRFDSAEYIARYYGSITYTDRWLGEFLDALEDLPGKTLLVITGDHGESLGEFDYWFEHGDNLRWPCVDVPLIMRCPGVIPSGTCDALVANTDLAPTILDLLDIPSDSLDADGRSLVPVMHDDDSMWDERMIPLQTYRGDVFRGVRSRYFSLQCRMGRGSGEPEEVEFFDRRTDPEEENNGADRFPEKCRAHLEFMDEFYSGTERFTRSRDLRGDPEMVERLKSLGYLGGER
jgi:arylsulfatase A-like enzyme